MADIAAFLNMARAGHREGALLGLTGLGPGAIPGLELAFRSEPDAGLRALLVEAVWKLRSPGSLEFLAGALGDPAPEVWRQALDGLTALASSASLRILETARDRAGDDEFARWVDQAIEDVNGRINE